MTVNASAVVPEPRGRWMGFCIIALVVLSVAGWCRLRIDSSLEPLLPENSEARKTVLFLRDSSFASKAILWFRLTGDGTLADLYTAADKIESKLDPKLIARVIRPPRESDAMDEVFALLDQSGRLLNEKDLSELDADTTPAALKKRMRECYIQLTKPEGGFMQQIIQRDPLGISTRILARLYSLTSGLGYRMEVKDGHFVHPDGRQLILILETTTSATNLAGSEALVSHLYSLAAAAPPGVRITPICGQIHTADNDEFMHKDVGKAGVIDAFAFLGLFLFVSRDWRVGAVFLLPLVTIAMTIGLCALFYPPLSSMMIGLAVTMAGSAVDYGIFVYTAVSMGRDPKADVRRIRRPLVISHLTTLGVFAAFLFSNIPAYRQLGCLTSLSLILSLLAAIFVLPKMIRPRGKITLLGRGMKLQRWGKLMVLPTILACVVFLVALIFAIRIRIDPDISKLDGISPQARQAEIDFQKTWSRSDTALAILAVSGKTEEEAAEINDKINSVVSPHMPSGDFVSLSNFWPSQATQDANLARWRAFWSPDRIAQFRKDLAAAGAPYGFSASAFDPFFKNLSGEIASSHSQQILSSLQEQFIARANQDWQMLSYFPDTDENVTAVRALLHDWPQAQVISQRALGQAFAESASSETKLLVTISSILIVVSLLVLTRSVVKSLLIMLPAGTGVVAMLALLVKIGLSMNVVTVITAILVLALASDYGVFAVYAWDNRETLLGQGMASIHLCVWTTCVATGALIFAQHPALYSVGVSMTSGLLGGYLTALIMIPGIRFLMDRQNNRGQA